MISQIEMLGGGVSFCGPRLPPARRRSDALDVRLVPSITLLFLRFVCPIIEYVQRVLLLPPAGINDYMYVRFMIDTESKS